MRRPDQRSVRRHRHHDYRLTAEHPLIEGVARVRHGRDATSALVRRVLAMVGVFMVAALLVAAFNRDGGGSSVGAPAAFALDGASATTSAATTAAVGPGVSTTAAKRKASSKKSKKSTTTTTTTDAPKKKAASKKKTTTTVATSSMRSKTSSKTSSKTASTKTTPRKSTKKVVKTTTTTTTTPTTTTTTTVPKKQSYTRDEIIQIIREEWPDELEDRAIAIAFRESSYNPKVRNYCCYGLFQLYWAVHKDWMTRAGVKLADLYDPRVNARLAYQLYLRAGGWSPWSQTAN